MVRSPLPICPHCNVRCPRKESGHCSRCNVHYMQPVIYPQMLNGLLEQRASTPFYFERLRARPYTASTGGR